MHFVSPLIQVFICYMMGISIGYQIPTAYNSFIYCSQLLAVTIYLLLSIQFIFHSYFHRLHNFFSSLLLIFFVLTGIIYTYHYKYVNHPNCLQRFLPNILAYKGFITESKSSLSHKTFVVKVSQICLRSDKENTNIKECIHDLKKWIPAVGKVKVSIFNPDDLQSSSPTDLTLNQGDSIYILGSPNPIPIYSPYGFSYQQFLHQQNIDLQQSISANHLLVISRPSLFTKFYSLITYCNDYFKKVMKYYISSPDVYHVMKAMLIGDKNDIDPNIRDAYTKTGTFHILAVSGLHVNILYLLLIYALGNFTIKTINGFLIQFIILIFIWFYAALTGFSPSIIRASYMFTIFLINRFLTRNTHIDHVIAFSSLIMLIINPLCLFSISFQLSYIAVMGIVYLQPKIYEAFSIQNEFLQPIWILCSVSIAAQIAAAPLSIYYFHSFPLYFLLANLFVVPCTLPLLMLSWLLILFSFVPFIAHITSYLITKLVHFMNAVVMLFSKLPTPGFLTQLYLSIDQLLLSYLLLLCITLYIYHLNIRYIRNGLIILLIWLSYSIYKDIYHWRFKAVYCYNNPNNPITLYIKNRRCCCVSQNPLTVSEYNRFIQSMQMHFKPIHIAYLTHQDLLVNQPTNRSPIWKTSKTLPCNLSFLYQDDKMLWQACMINQKRILLIEKMPISLNNKTRQTSVDIVILNSNLQKNKVELVHQVFQIKYLLIQTRKTNQSLEHLKEEIRKAEIPFQILDKNNFKKVMF